MNFLMMEKENIINYIDIVDNLLDPIITFNDMTFLRDSAHESIIAAGYLLDCRCVSRPIATSPSASGLKRNRFGPSWGQSGAKSSDCFFLFDGRSVPTAFSPPPPAVGMERSRHIRSTNLPSAIHPQRTENL